MSIDLNEIFQTPSNVNLSYELPEDFEDKQQLLDFLKEKVFYCNLGVSKIDFNNIGDESEDILKKVLTNTMCIEGRYKPDDLCLLSYPGANIGIFAKLLTFSNKLQEKYGIILEKNLIKSFFLEKIGGIENLHIHSDSKEDISKGADTLGCGHIELLLSEKDSYFLNDEDTELINSLVKEYLQCDDEHAFPLVNFEGEHNEKVFIDVKILDYTVAHSGANNFQSFVLHSAFGEAINVYLLQSMYKNGFFDNQFFYNHEQDLKLADFLEDLREIDRLHGARTARKLAKGLPYLVLAEDENGNLKISYKGKIN